MVVVCIFLMTNMFNAFHGLIGHLYIFFGERSVQGHMGGLVKPPTLNSPQVTILWFMGSSPTSGSLLSVWSPLWILSPSLSVPPLLELSLSLSLKNKYFGELLGDSVG